MTNHNDSSGTSRRLDQASRGDRLAVDRLLEGHRTYLRKLIDLRMDDELRVRVDPSDVVQETQLTAIKRIDEFLRRRPTTFRLWLRAKALDRLTDIQRRHIYAEKRSVRREFRISERSSIALSRCMVDQAVEGRIVAEEMTRKVRRAMGRLTPTDREVLLLRHVEELSNGEAAEVLGVKPATASQRYGRAVRKLREALKHRGIEDD